VQTNCEYPDFVSGEFLDSTGSPVDMKTACLNKLGIGYPDPNNIVDMRNFWNKCRTKCCYTPAEGTV
jgi:hypothetical protein